MEELCIIAFVLLVVLTIVTLVGHGIWVGLAWLLRGGTSSRRRPASCPRCRMPLAEDRKECGICQWPGPLPAGPRRRAVLDKLQSQLTHLAAIGALDEATRTLLTASIDSLLTEPSPQIETETSGIEFEEAEPLLAEVLDAEPDAAESAVPEPTSVAPDTSGTSAPAERGPVDMPERVRRYAHARETAAQEAAEAPQSPTPPARREALSRVLSAFMEERNIRWGELVGGMLIVCCSIALVISFWAQIAQRPLLKFGIFNGLTAVLFGAGFYTLHRWQIKTTSQGLLIIATMLVPLNFLAIAAFTQESPPTDILSIGGEVFSLAVFAALCYFAARTLAPSGPILLAAGVMLTSAAQLITRRFAGPDAALTTLYTLAAIPVGCYVAIAGLYLWRGLRDRGDVKADASLSPARVFIMLGVTTYAALLPLGLLVHQCGAIAETLSQLSPLASLFALPALAVGLLFWRQLASPVTAAEQTIGIGVGVAGGVVLAAALVLAWPAPALLLPTAVTTALVFAVLAIKFDLPEAHVVTAVCALAAWLVGFHLLRGDVAWTLDHKTPLLRVILSAAAGNALVPLVGCFAATAWGLGYVGRKGEARWYWTAAAATVAVSLLLLVGYGFARVGDPAGVTWSLAVYAFVLLAATWRTRRTDVAGIATTLALAAIVQGVVYRYGDTLELARPWVVALLTHATLIGVVTITFRGRRATNGWALVFYGSTLATSAAATGLLVYQITSLTGYAMAGYLGWMAAVWLAIAMATRWQAVFAIFQLIFFCSLASLVVGAVENRIWYIEARYPWLDPWFIQLQGVALALYCSVCSLVRLLLAKFAGDSGNGGVLARIRGLLHEQFVGVDRLLEVVVLLLLTFIAIYSAVPGVAQELALTPKGERVAPALSQFTLDDVPHEHAMGWGGWLLLLAAAVMLTVGMWRDFLASRVVALLLVAGLACPLLAAAWQGDVASASALRWVLGGFAVLASVPIWGRTWLRRAAIRAGIGGASISSGERAIAIDRLARAVLIVFIVSAYAAMGVYVGVSAVGRAGVPQGIVPVLQVLAVVCVVACLVALVVAAIERTTRTADANAWSQPATLLWQTLLMMGASPLLAACIYVVADALRQYPVLGPAPGTWFATIGTSASYGVPLAAIILALLGHAARQRSPSYALSGALFVNLLTSVVYLIELARSGRPLDSTGWIVLAQVNAIAAAVFSLGWLAAVARWGRRPTVEAPSTPALLSSYIAFGAALCGVTIVWGVAYLAAFPDLPSRVAAAGQVVGWISLGLTTAAVVWLSWRLGGQYAFVALAGSLGVLVSMIALTAIRWDRGDWLAYHTLLAGFATTAYLTPLMARLLAKRDGLSAAGTAAMLVTTMFAAITIALSLRAVGGDPQWPWWNLAGITSIAVLSAILAWVTARRHFVWTAACLLHLAVSIWWIESGHSVLSAGFGASVRDFFYVNAIAAAIMAIYSVVIERRRLAREFPSHGIAWHDISVWVIAVTLLLVVFSGLLADVNGAPEGIGWLAVIALGAAVAAGLARLWDPESRFTVACLYSIGAIGPAMLLDALNIAEPQLFLWAATMFAAAYALATSYLWSRRRELTAWASRCGVPLALGAAARKSDLPTYPGHAWLLCANGVIAVLVVMSVFWLECTHEVWIERSTAAYAILAVAVAVAFLSRGALRSPLQYLSLLCGVLFAMAWGLSWLAPDVEGPLLNRAIVCVVALAVMTLLYGFGLVKLWKRQNEWTAAGERLMPWLTAVTAVLVASVVGGEIAHYIARGHVPVAWPARLAVALALSGLALAALAAAVLSGRDPLGLSERGRTMYVYAAEIIAALLFAHIRVTMPWLFTGWIQAVWPLVTMGVAFLGVGFSEYCRRRRQAVLAGPLATTAALLPVLPVMGFWLVPHSVNYSVVLLTVAALYAALALMRRSFAFTMLAVLAANGSLWRLLYTREGLGLAEHPQLWLIPPAVCVLVASYLNRRRLSEQQTTAIRYLAAIVIYASSTADIFLNGVAAAPWLPGVLAAVAIVGIFAGIIFRIRAFLFLGTTFLMVALVTIIWYAAVELEHTWLWWVSGIVAGVLIMTLFGLFEKKRDDVLQIIDNMKQWDA